MQKECLRCKEVPDFFLLHGRRLRYVLLVEGGQVIRKEVWLRRFYCSECRHIFSEYPVFVMPHKHYVAGNLAEFGYKYVEQEQCSYREAVKVNGVALYHECKALEVLVAEVCEEKHGTSGSKFPKLPADDATLEKLGERRLSHSTLWRLIGFWGSKTAYLQQLLDLLEQKCSDPDLFRKLQFVAEPAKHRSAERKNILETFARLCIAANEYFVQFGRQIFPDFETQLRI